MSSCEGCAYWDGNSCMIWVSSSEPCGKPVLFEDAQQREIQCGQYAKDRGEYFAHGKFRKFIATDETKPERIQQGKENRRRRGGTVKQVLDEQYDALSAQGLADAQIAEMLYMRERTLRTWKRERR